MSVKLNGHGIGRPRRDLFTHLREEKAAASKGVHCSPSLTQEPLALRNPSFLGFTLFWDPSALGIKHAAPQFFHLLGRTIPRELIMRLRRMSCERAKRPRRTSCVYFEIHSVTCPGYSFTGLLYEMRGETNQRKASQCLQKGDRLQSTSACRQQDQLTHVPSTIRNKRTHGKMNLPSRVKRLGSTAELLFGRRGGINSKIKKRLGRVTLGQSCSLDITGEDWMLGGGECVLIISGGNPGLYQDVSRPSDPWPLLTCSGP